MCSEFQRTGFFVYHFSSLSFNLEDSQNWLWTVIFVRLGGHIGDSNSEIVKLYKRGKIIFKLEGQYRYLRGLLHVQLEEPDRPCSLNYWRREGSRTADCAMKGRRSSHQDGPWKGTAERIQWEQTGRGRGVSCDREGGRGREKRKATRKNRWKKLRKRKIDC